MNESQHTKLLSALTDFDRRGMGKPGYNPYALGHYARGLAHVGRHCAAGHALRDAILSEFVGPLADKLLKAVGLEKRTRAEATGNPPLPELPDE